MAMPIDAQSAVTAGGGAMHPAIDLRGVSKAFGPVHVCGPDGRRKTFPLGELPPDSSGPGNPE